MVLNMAGKISEVALAIIDSAVCVSVVQAADTTAPASAGAVGGDNVLSQFR